METGEMMKVYITVILALYLFKITDLIRTDEKITEKIATMSIMAAIILAIIFVWQI
jgi:hypothetical protein